MIEREINNDFRTHTLHFGNTAGAHHKSAKGLTMVDYGSNKGYFSLKLARTYTDATVISIEGEAYKGIIVLLS